MKTAFVITKNDLYSSYVYRIKLSFGIGFSFNLLLTVLRLLSHAAKQMNVSGIFTT